MKHGPSSQICVQVSRHELVRADTPRSCSRHPISSTHSTWKSDSRSRPTAELSSSATAGLLFGLMYKECLRRAALGRPTKQAARMFSKILAAIEVFVRMIGWWVLLPNWVTLRLSDHKGLLPGQITVKDRGLSGTLSRSKMLGSDKSIGSRPVVVHAEKDWLKQGWAPLSEVANFSRDCLLPVPTSSLQGCLPAELLYSAGFALLNRLLCSLRFLSAPLLVPQVVHFWTPHSGRSFMPSCTAVLGFENTQRDFLGGWSAQESDRCARVKKLRVEKEKKENSSKNRCSRCAVVGRTNGSVRGSQRTSEEEESRTCLDAH